MDRVEGDDCRFDASLAFEFTQQFSDIGCITRVQQMSKIIDIGVGGLGNARETPNQRLTSRPNKKPSIFLIRIILSGKGVTASSLAGRYLLIVTASVTKRKSWSSYLRSQDNLRNGADDVRIQAKRGILMAEKANRMEFTPLSFLPRMLLYFPIH